MPKTTPAEWILAGITTPARAAALYGDLLELAQTRGRFWFWTTYARTLLALTWRPPAAFAVGLASLAGLDRVWQFYVRYHPGLWHPSTHPYLHDAVFYLALQFWFLAPFAATRYGFGDRLVRLSLPAALMTTGVLLNVPLLSPLLAATGIGVAAIALGHTSSRRSAATLVATGVVGAFTLLNLLYLAHMFCWIDEHKPLNASSHYHYFETGFAFYHTLFWVVMWTMALLNALVLAFLCSRLHRTLIESEPSGVAHA